MKFEVCIPNWTEGVSLSLQVEAPDRNDALAKAIAWVNDRAGYQYCTELPYGTTVQACFDGGSFKK